MFFLINIFISAGLGVIEGLLNMPGIISGIYSLAILVPSIAVAVRRLHDTDRRGWWILVPILGLVYLAQAGKPGSNRFGSDPKAAAQ
jgi:uncharacterized membrane protein YhaH (DUF805 family)